MSDAVALCRTIVTLDALYLDVRYKNEDQQVCELWLSLGKRLLEYMELAQLLLGGGLWTSFLDQRDCFF